MTQWEDEQRQRLQEDIWAHDNRRYQQERAAQNGNSSDDGGGVIPLILGAVAILGAFLGGVE